MIKISCNMQANSCTEIVPQESKRDKVLCTKKQMRGQTMTGLTHECGVFGCIAAGDWPSQIDVAQVICLGKFTNAFTMIYFFRKYYIISSLIFI